MFLVTRLVVAVLLAVAQAAALAPWSSDPALITEKAFEMTKAEAIALKGGFCTLRSIPGSVEFYWVRQYPRVLDAAFTSRLKTDCAGSIASGLLKPDEPHCCTADLLVKIESVTDLVRSYLKQCPACYHGVEVVLCMTSCSPTQGATIRPIGDNVIEGTSEELQKVSELHVVLAADNSNKQLDACRGLKAAGGVSALDAACTLVGLDCVDAKGLEKSSPSFAPSMHLHMTATEAEDFDASALPEPEYGPMKPAKMAKSLIFCNEPTPEGDAACACADCPLACT